MNRDKKNLWSKMVILTVFIFLISSSLSSAQMGFEQKQATISETHFEIEYTVTFSSDDLIFNKFMGYDMVGLKEGMCVNVVGKPFIFDSKTHSKNYRVHHGDSRSIGHINWIKFVSPTSRTCLLIVSSCKS